MGWVHARTMRDTHLSFQRRTSKVRHPGADRSRQREIGSRPRSMQGTACGWRRGHVVLGVARACPGMDPGLCPRCARRRDDNAGLKVRHHHFLASPATAGRQCRPCAEPGSSPEIEHDAAKAYGLPARGKIPDSLAKLGFREGRKWVGSTPGRCATRICHSNGVPRKSVIPAPIARGSERSDQGRDPCKAPLAPTSLWSSASDTGVIIATNAAPAINGRANASAVSTSLPKI